MFWCCPSLVSFWKDVFSTLSEISSIKIEPDPLTALFGVSSPMLQLSKIKEGVIVFIMLLAKQSILFQWKCSTLPSHTYWIKKVLNWKKIDKHLKDL